MTEEHQPFPPSQAEPGGPGQPQPYSYGQPQPSAYGQPQPYPLDQHPGASHAYGMPYPLVPQEHPQGTAVLVLGILGFVSGICAPIAWFLGSRALREIRASGVTYSNEQSIVVGRILGMVVTLLMLVGIVFLVVFILVIAFAASSTS